MISECGVGRRLTTKLSGNGKLASPLRMSAALVGRHSFSPKRVFYNLPMFILMNSRAS
jgi:hypothetical protein